MRNQESKAHIALSKYLFSLHVENRAKYRTNWALNCTGHGNDDISLEKPLKMQKPVEVLTDKVPYLELFIFVNTFQFYLVTRSL
jgi:hypothetical protein